METMNKNYAASRAFVREMRALTRSRDVASLQKAVQEMRNWLLQHPQDVVVGTALEEFDILLEAAQIKQVPSNFPTPELITKNS